MFRIKCSRRVYWRKDPETPQWRNVYRGVVSHRQVPALSLTAASRSHNKLNHGAILKQVKGSCQVSLCGGEPGAAGALGSQ